MLIGVASFLSFPSRARSRLSAFLGLGGGRAATAWLCFVLAPLAAQYSWHSWKELQVLVPSYSLDYSIGDLFNAMGPRASPAQKDTCDRFWRVLRDQPIGSPRASAFLHLCTALGLPEPRRLPAMTARGWSFVALGLFSMAVLIAGPTTLRIRLAFTAVIVFLSLAIYVLALVSLYLFAFTYAESISLSGLPRYLWSYLFSAVVMALAFIVHIGRSVRLSRPVLSRCACLFCVTFLCYLYFFQNTALVVAAPHESSTPLPFRVAISPQIQFLCSRTAPEDRVFIICQDATGMEHNVISYEIFPRRFNRKHFSLGSPHGDYDFWTSNISPQFLSDTIKTGKYKYVYVARSNDELWQKYGGFFEQGTTVDDFLFSVSADEAGEVRLIPVR